MQCEVFHHIIFSESYLYICVSEQIRNSVYVVIRVCGSIIYYLFRLFLLYKLIICSILYLLRFENMIMMLSSLSLVL